jgi:two-component system, OmpR family, response regulator
MTTNRLLVVDDESAIGLIIAAAAMDCGYDARATASAKAFKSQLLIFRPTLVALDLSMPGEDGIELLRYLADAGCTAGILIVSGFDRRVIECAALLATSRGLRMLGTIPKPFRLSTLRELFVALRHDEQAQPTEPTQAAARESKRRAQRG